MPLGTICAQLVHAAGESSPGNLPEGTHAVVLAVPNEQTLLAIEEKLKHAQIKYNAIREPDPPYLGQLMAIGLEPTTDRTRMRKLLSTLPLLR